MSDLAKGSASKKLSKPKKKLLAPSKLIVPEILSTKDLYEDDFARTLFPLKTNLELIRFGESQISDYIEKCLDDKKPEFQFAQQRRAYATKPGLHLRRTYKLDVAAEYYLYDVIFRNRKKFRKPRAPNRSHFGYRFEKNVPISSTEAYKAFRGAVSEYRDDYKYLLSIDVASYFNSIYHHDLVNWFEQIEASPIDVKGFGQLLRQMSSGRSLDCLPQGLYPAKMIGNDFLRYVEENFELKSEKIVRFMDDMYLFSDDQHALRSDFLSLQRLLGDKGLSVNPKKTSWTDAAHVELASEIDDAKRDLLKRRRVLVTVGYDEDGDEEFQEAFLKTPLSTKELDYLGSILEKDEVEEEDAELVLTIMRDHTGRVEKRLPYILSQFPNLAKNVWSFCRFVENKEIVAEHVFDVLKGQSQLTEYQLFWFGYMLDDYLLETSKAASLLEALFNHRSATPISKAKILEIPDKRFGLTELRIQNLSTGASEWLSWSSAVGMRSLGKQSRNQALNYFANGSQINRLISSIVTKMS